MKDSFVDTSDIDITDLPLRKILILFIGAVAFWAFVIWLILTAFSVKC